MASKKWDKKTQKTIIKLTISFKTDVFIVLTVIENIPDLKVRLLTGIGLSSGYLLVVEFFLFFWTFSRIFSLFLFRGFLFDFYPLQGFLTSFDVIFHDLIATRRAIIYGHTWGLDQQKYFFERPKIEL